MHALVFSGFHTCAPSFVSYPPSEAELSRSKQLKHQNQLT